MRPCMEDFIRGSLICRSLLSATEHNEITCATEVNKMLSSSVGSVRAMTIIGCLFSFFETDSRGTYANWISFWEEHEEERSKYSICCFSWRENVNKNIIVSSLTEKNLFGARWRTVKVSDCAPNTIGKLPHFVFWHSNVRKARAGLFLCVWRMLCFRRVGNVASSCEKSSPTRKQRSA